MLLNNRNSEHTERLISLPDFSKHLAAQHTPTFLAWITSRLEETNLTELMPEDLLNGLLEALTGSSSVPLLKLLRALHREKSISTSSAPLNVAVLREARKKMIDIISDEIDDSREALKINGMIDDLFLEAEDNWRNEVDTQQLEIFEQVQHFNTRITNTIPGIIFILDLFKFKEVYVNRNAEYFFGYSHDDLQEMGTELMSRLIHPDDIPVLQNKVGDFATCEEGDVRVYEFRLKTRHGEYSWVRSYESVYRRTDNGSPRQVIGIAIDITKEKITSQMLERREQQLLQAQKIAGIGSFELEIETFTGEITAEALNILELTSSYSLSTFMDNVHEDDREYVRNTLAEAVQQQGNYDLECRYSADLGFKAIWLRGAFQNQGTKQVLTGTVMDITARYNLLQQLKKSEQLYKQAEALSHLGNWNWNLDEDSIFWSDELFRIYGLDPNSKTINFDDYLAMVHPEERSMMQHTIMRCLESRIPFQVTHRALLANGRIRYIQGWGEVKVDEKNKVVQMFGTAQDITEKQLLLDKLKQSELLYREAQSLAHIGNWSWDTRNNSFTLSEELYRIFEMGPVNERFSIEDLFENFFPEERSAIQHILQKSIEDKKRFSFTHKYKAPSGLLKTLQVLGEVRVDPNTDNVVIVGTSQDITEQEEIEQQLRNKQLELEQSNTSLREYAYVASHDLQEPLRKISTFADRLRLSYGSKIPEAAMVYVEKIISSSIRMQQMIHDLLSVSIISSERSFELVSLDRLFTDALHTFEDSIESKKLMIKAESLPEARVIPSQFRQLFQNLLSNSIKFSKKDTICVIDVTTEWLKDPATKVRHPMPGMRYLQLQFADNGIGFDNQFAEKIFNIFQRLHPKHEYEGTGIGLAICKRIVENHHGIIEASGAEGRGAVFTLIIPA